MDKQDHSSNVPCIVLSPTCSLKRSSRAVTCPEKLGLHCADLSFHVAHYEFQRGKRYTRPQSVPHTQYGHFEIPLISISIPISQGALFTRTSEPVTIPSLPR